MALGVGTGSIEGIAYEQVVQYAEDIKNAANNVKRLLEEVTEKMRNVNTESLWRSQAAETTYHKFQALAKTFEGLYNELMAYHKFLINTVATYKEADRVISAKAEELLSVDV